MPLSLRAATVVRAPAAQVYALLSTPERLPEWNGAVERACRAMDQPIGLGSRALVSGRFLGQTLDSETEVVEFDPPRAFATRALRGPRLVTRFVLELSDAQPDLTRVTLDVTGEVPGGRMGAMLAEGLLRSELSASMERLRGICEREAPRSGAPNPPR
jgi:uncharacterized membrane protein